MSLILSETEQNVVIPALRVTSGSLIWDSIDLDVTLIILPESESPIIRNTNITKEIKQATKKQHRAYNSLERFKESSFHE